MTRYFPEVVEAVRANLPPRCVSRRDHRPRRRRPAARLRRPAAAHPPPRPAASGSWPPRPRPGWSPSTCSPWTRPTTSPSRSPPAGRLEQALGRVRAPVHLSPGHHRPPTPWPPSGSRRFEGAGLDDIIAKALDGVYEPDQRAWRKVKHTRTADCVVAGTTGSTSAARTWSARCCWACTPTRVSWPWLGIDRRLPDGAAPGCSPSSAPGDDLRGAHPWDWGAWKREAEAEGRAWRGSNTSPAGTPARSCRSRPCGERVVEVHDHPGGPRFPSAPPRFNRWRPNPRPRSCTYDQLEETVSYDLAEVLATPTT